MLRKFLPDEHVESIFEISAEHLKQHGIKAVITDLDNTLVEWNRPYATSALLKWIQSMKESGIVITIVSNNSARRVKQFSDPIEIPFIHKARKPMTKAFKRAMKDMNVKKDDIVIVGDQVLTDVFGGNRLGVHTILVVPIAKGDGFFTKMNRRVERYLLAWMKRKGMIFWED